MPERNGSTQKKDDTEKYEQVRKKIERKPQGGIQDSKF